MAGSACPVATYGVIPPPFQAEDEVEEVASPKEAHVIGAPERPRGACRTALKHGQGGKLGGGGWRRSQWGESGAAFRDVVEHGDE